eukprot:2528315-Amphidinium_carterae.1
MIRSGNDGTAAPTAGSNVAFMLDCHKRSKRQYRVSEVVVVVFEQADSVSQELDTAALVSARPKVMDNNHMKEVSQDFMQPSFKSMQMNVLLFHVPYPTSVLAVACDIEVVNRHCGKREWCVVAMQERHACPHRDNHTHAHAHTPTLTQ